MASPFFQTRPQQVRILVLLTLLWFGVIFNPGIRRALSSVFRSNPVRNDRIQVVIPRTWLVDQEDSEVTAWIPCMTTFCSQPRALVTLRINDWLTEHKEVWQTSTEATFKEYGFSTSRLRTFNPSTGLVRCIEGSHETGGGRARSICLAFQSGILSSYEGVQSELNTFYAMVTSANGVRQN